MRRLERLSQTHRVQAFESGEFDLDSWLHDSAVTSDRAGSARVYVWLEVDDEVVGYFAVVPHTVRREEVPSSVGRGSPNVIPGFLIARLALAGSHQGRGEGGELLVASLNVILQAIRTAGGRVIVVDAINERAAAFYEHFGFQRVPMNAGRLILKASSAAASFSLAWP